MHVKVHLVQPGLEMGERRFADIPPLTIQAKTESAADCEVMVVRVCRCVTVFFLSCRNLRGQARRRLNSVGLVHLHRRRGACRSLGPS